MTITNIILSNAIQFYVVLSCKYKEIITVSIRKNHLNKFAVLGLYIVGTYKPANLHAEEHNPNVAEEFYC